LIGLGIRGPHSQANETKKILPQFGGGIRGATGIGGLGVSVRRAKLYKRGVPKLGLVEKKRHKEAMFVIQKGQQRVRSKPQAGRGMSSGRGGKS